MREKKAKRNKYNVGPKEKRTYRGVLFDSIWECEFYKLLLLFVVDDKIERQVPFTLIDGYRMSGRKVRPTLYYLDFLVDGKHIDAKGHRTKEFLIKKKLFEVRYGHELHCPDDKRNYQANIDQVAKILEL